MLNALPECKKAASSCVSERPRTELGIPSSLFGSARLVQVFSRHSDMNVKLVGSAEVPCFGKCYQKREKQKL